MVTRQTWRTVFAAGAIAALALPAAASAHSRVNRPAAAGVQSATQAVRAAMRMPVWKAPGSSVKMASLRGKRVFVLTSTLAVPFVSAIAKGTMQAAKLARWKANLVDGKGTVSEWNRFMAQAISQKYDAIISIAASPEVMKPQMAAARKAGIPVIDVLTADKASTLVPGTFSHVSISFYRSGQLQADYAIMASKGKAHALIFGDNEFPGEVTRVQGMNKEFKTLCPACKSTFQDTQVAKLGTALGTTAQTLLRRDPSINWVLPTYDAQGLYIVPAIKQGGFQSKVKVVGSDAVASNLNWTAKADVQVADVGEPSIWTGWAAVDEIGRAMLKMPAVDENIPLRMFVPSNLKGVTTTNELQLWGGSFKSKYKSLWGLH